MAVETVRFYGAQSERWRYQFLDASKARLHALSEDTGASQNLDSWGHINSEEVEDGIIDHFMLERFKEIPKSEMSPSSWNTVVSFRVRHSDNILGLDGSGAVVGAEHLLRDSKAIGKRLHKRSCKIKISSKTSTQTLLSLIGLGLGYTLQMGA
eukprot:9486290-Karenia_brevis.AAC.1